MDYYTVILCTIRTETEISEYRENDFRNLLSVTDKHTI